MPNEFTWCSFADGDDGHSLGCLILKGKLDAPDAARLAWRLHLNPGGEMLCVSGDVTDERLAALLLANIGRLMPKAEAERIFGENGYSMSTP